MADTKMSATTSLERLTLSDAIGNPNTAAKQWNFPVPREIRDQIYGYLVHHDHTKAPPYCERGSSEQGEVSV